MSKKQVNHIVRAWKDQEYRNSLSAEEIAQLPEHPAGMIELEDSALKGVLGGAWCISGNTSCMSIIINP